MKSTLNDLAKQASSLQKTADDLCSRLEMLATFRECAQWNADALAVIRLLERFRSDLEAFRSRKQQALGEVEAARRALPFFKRLFASRAVEKAHTEDIAQVDMGVTSVDKAISDLYERIDRTPTNKAQQKEMLSELRLVKRELTTEKRSINEAMRLTRSKARQDMASWTGVSRGFVGAVARVERMEIRHQKEAALRPREDAKAALERQLIDIERRVTRVSRFKGDDPEEERGVLRCAYCGRRVLPNKPCPGCGSDQTTLDP